MRRLAFKTVAVVLLLGAGMAFAMWALVPLEKLVADNPVIIIGKIEKIEEAPRPVEGTFVPAYDTALITVSKVLKNTLEKTPIKAGDKLPLATPSKNRLMMVSTDITYSLGQKGIWLLELKDGKYWATYPGDLQPLDKEQEITGIIRKQTP